ncbi:UNVERIFIED_CONTAM: hypothetical protein K2H54_060303 [Gekko kuhli]
MKFNSTDSPLKLRCWKTFIGFLLLGSLALKLVVIVIILTGGAQCNCPGGKEFISSRLHRNRSVTHEQCIPPAQELLYADVHLDQNTAYHELTVSPNEKHVKWSLSLQHMADNSSRFDLNPCVLGREGFTSGIHLWEVDVRMGWHQHLSSGFLPYGKLEEGKDLNKTYLVHTRSSWSVNMECRDSQKDPGLRRRKELPTPPSDGTQGSQCNHTLKEPEGPWKNQTSKIKTFAEGKVPEQGSCIPSQSFLYADVILDRASASSELIISSDQKSVTLNSLPQNIPHYQDLYHTLACVRGHKGFTNGKHWWEQPHSAVMASSLAEDLVCPICLALFQEPHMLGCGHNFCLACVRSAVPAGQEEATCPECRGPFQLRELKRNRALGSLAKKVRGWKGDEEALLLPGSSAGLWHFCEAHDEPLKLFCTQDEAPICVICRDLPQHRGHDFLPTKNAVQLAQGKLKAYLKHLEKHRKETMEDKTDQLKEIEALEGCTKDLLDDISKEFEALHQILHKKEQDFKLMVEKMKVENMEEMEDSLTSLLDEAFTRTETIDKVKATLEGTDYVAFLKGLKELMERVKKDHQGETEDDEEGEDDEENDDEEAEGKSDKDGSGDEHCEGCDCEDEGSEDDEDEDEGDEDYEPDETGRYGDDDRVVPVDLALENFGESLDFDTWKEMLEGIQPRQV